jgi:hypothetical protein
MNDPGKIGVMQSSRYAGSVQGETEIGNVIRQIVKGNIKCLAGTKKPAQ